MSKTVKQAADRPRVDPLGDLKIAEARGECKMWANIV